MPDPREIAAGLSEAERRVILEAEVLVDGRILVPAYSIPDHLTAIYSVHRSKLNRLGLAVRAILEERNGTE